MDSFQEKNYTSSTGPTTPADLPPSTGCSSDHIDSTKSLGSPVQNGYNNVANHVSHKQKQEKSGHNQDDKILKHSKPSSSLIKHHSEKHHNSEKHHSSDKHKNSDQLKNKVHTSSSDSKLKLSLKLGDSPVKNHSIKSSDHIKIKDHHHHDKEKHSSSLKTKDGSSKSSDHKEKHISKDISKHKEKKDGEKLKSEKHGEHIKKDSSKHGDHLKKEDKHSDHIKKEDKHSAHKIKTNEHKQKDGSIKEKVKSDKEDKHKDIKIKSEKEEKHGELKIKIKDGKELKEKHKESKHKVKDKHKTEDSKEKPKIKDANEPKEKHKSLEKNSESIKLKHHESPHKEKRPLVVKVKEPKPEVNHTAVKIKEEVNYSPVKQEVFSDDDVSLHKVKGDYSEKMERKAMKQNSKPVKREKGSESDEEPLSLRAEKVKKLKTEKPVKKRKLDDDDDDYYDIKPKKIKKEKKVKTTSKAIKKEPSEVPSPKKRGKQKEEEQEVWKWWEEEKPSDGKKWNTLQHKGPVFAPLYEPLPKNVHFYYDKEKMKLSPEAEEVAGFYAVMLEHDYVTKDVFNDNFFKCWRKVMTQNEKEIITDLKKCNFKELYVYYKQKSEERKNRTKEEKLITKKQNEALQEEYGYCIIDGHKQKVGNFKIEPPGLFRGRGEHPKMGMLKRRVQPEDVIINIGKDCPVPQPPEGHKWKNVRHDNTVTWLASWNENILGQTKYVMLNPGSKLKGEKDWQKYETARKLKNHADRIRREYQEDWKSKEMKVRQRAVALYFIDKLALRAGNEKEADETADTVGCCSLRVEHITLDEEKDGKEFVVGFDFLGKDSIRYENSVSVEKRVFKNLRLFIENKQPGDDLFDRLNTAILNKYLTELMDGLTAKVFRTYNASKTLQEQLNLLTKSEMSVPEKLLAYNRANRAVAILCNHQRSVPKGFSKAMENLQKKIDEKLEQRREFKKEVKQAKQLAKESGSNKDHQLYEKKKKRLDQIGEQLKRLEVQATDREENKQIALGTSKLNYLDPRISVAWCKKWEVPIEKIYNKTQRDKFRWAIDMAGAEYQF